MKKYHRKRNVGVVVSDKMDKTVTVLVQTRKPHSKYQKVVTTGKKFYAHDENNSCSCGDKVTIEETRPLSKMKTWRVVETV
jgi:small subunit ribosomal protein S17